MRTVFDPAAREQLLARLARLTPGMQPAWGKFTATKMVAHVNDALQMAIGELAVAPKRSALRNPFGRWLGIYAPIPWPKGVPTAPELLARGTTDAVQFEAERSAFSQLLARVAARKGAGKWPEHPLFGRMREKDWGALGYRHLDHHFRQFGI